MPSSAFNVNLLVGIALAYSHRLDKHPFLGVPFPDAASQCVLEAIGNNGSTFLVHLLQNFLSVVDVLASYKVCTCR